MRKRIFNRLSVKVFLITFIIQIVAGGLICGTLYLSTPETYRDTKDEGYLKVFHLSRQLSGVPEREGGDRGGSRVFCEAEIGQSCSEWIRQRVNDVDHERIDEIDEDLRHIGGADPADGRMELVEGADRAGFDMIRMGM